MGPQMIFLIGMPAAGKTYWGVRIADEFGWDFVDLDNYVSECESASIPELFAMYGEVGFREREQESLKQIIDKHTEQTVVACGGGTPCFFDNIALMKAAGTVIYLEVDGSILVERLETSTIERPLLLGRGNMAAYLKDTLENRRLFYEQAHFKFTVEAISLDNFAKIMSL